MNNFTYITPKAAAAKGIDGGCKDVKHYEKLCNLSGTCCNCDEDIWKLLNNEMCFSCTTGEWDASDDYELEW